jgi:hypothetical protein
MNRRSFLSFLVAAPVAAPFAAQSVAARSAAKQAVTMSFGGFELGGAWSFSDTGSYTIRGVDLSGFGLSRFEREEMKALRALDEAGRAAEVVGKDAESFINRAVAAVDTTPTKIVDLIADAGGRIEKLMAPRAAVESQMIEHDIFEPAPCRCDVEVAA